MSAAGSKDDTCQIARKSPATRTSTDMSAGRSREQGNSSGVLSSLRAAADSHAACYCFFQVMLADVMMLDEYAATHLHGHFWSTEDLPQIQCLRYQSGKTLDKAISNNPHHPLCASRQPCSSPYWSGVERMQLQLSRRCCRRWIFSAGIASARCYGDHYD